jgi:hypothetical protein
MGLVLEGGAMVQNSKLHVQAYANGELALLLIDTGAEGITFRLSSALAFEPTRHRRANSSRETS